jgi:hypothetical protein
MELLRDSASPNENENGNGATASSAASGAFESAESQSHNPNPPSSPVKSLTANITGLDNGGSDGVSAEPAAFQHHPVNGAAVAGAAAAPQLPPRPVLAKSAPASTTDGVKAVHETFGRPKGNQELLNECIDKLQPALDGGDVVRISTAFSPESLNTLSPLQADTLVTGVAVMLGYFLGVSYKHNSCKPTKDGTHFGIAKLCTRNPTPEPQPVVPDNDDDANPVTNRCACKARVSFGMDGIKITPHNDACLAIGAKAIGSHAKTAHEVRQATEQAVESECVNKLEEMYRLARELKKYQLATALQRMMREAGANELPVRYCYTLIEQAITAVVGPMNEASSVQRLRAWLKQINDEGGRTEIIYSDNLETGVDVLDQVLIMLES